MRRIASAFESLAGSGSGAYVPYLCAGDPDAGFTLELADRLCAAGADVIELGLPFSDPVADGPVIQEAMGRSLSGGFKVENIFKVISSLRSSGVKQPIVVMTYYNPVHKLGSSRFCDQLASSGGDGILVVDLPIEESADLEASAEKNSLDIIRLVTPTTDDDRLRSVLAKASGFVYIVSVAGVTGAREGFDDAVTGLVKRVSGLSKLPTVIGFGISNPEHVKRALATGASGIVEGSALISSYSGMLDERERALGAAERHAKAMKDAARPLGR
jgi:tryptophan synthase alpha chain